MFSSCCQVEVTSCFIVFITLFLVHCFSNLKFSSCCQISISCFVDFISNVLVFSSCHETNQLLFCVSLTSSLVFLCRFLVVKLVTISCVSSSSMSCSLETSNFQKLLHRNRFVGVLLCF